MKGFWTKLCHGDLIRVKSGFLRFDYNLICYLAPLQILYNILCWLYHQCFFNTWIMFVKLNRLFLTQPYGHCSARPYLFYIYWQASSFVHFAFATVVEALFKILGKGDACMSNQNCDHSRMWKIIVAFKICDLSMLVKLLNCLVSGIICYMSTMWYYFTQIYMCYLWISLLFFQVFF